MFIARILYPVKVLGPGNRIGIWFDGCSHKCKGCSNPELWEFQERYEIPFENVVKLIESISSRNIVDGFTITGGDPFEQAEDLNRLLPELKKISEDIIVYTGYKYDTLKMRYKDILDKIALLIDGPYIEAQNENCFMRGSSNQQLIVLDPEFTEFYDAYIKDGCNEIQNFTLRDGVISVGIHRAGYDAELNKKLHQKGLEEY